MFNVISSVRTGDTSYLEMLKASSDTKSETSLDAGPSSMIVDIPFEVGSSHSRTYAKHACIDFKLCWYQVELPPEEEKQIIESNAHLDELIPKRAAPEKEKETATTAKKPSASDLFPELPIDGSLRVHLNLLPLLGSFQRTKKTLLIIVADRSSSMKGKPWSQVDRKKHHLETR